MKSYSTKVYGAKAGEPLRHVQDFPLCVADDADRCREVVAMLLPENIKSMENLFIVSREIKPVNT